MRCKIDGTEIEFDEISYSSLPLGRVGREEYYLAESTTSAGEAARARWESMAQDDPKEFACMVGDETLVQWGLGRHAGPGSSKVKNLEEWLDLWLDTPHEEFASYDGTERDVTEPDAELCEELGFTPTVAYRAN